MTGTHTIIWRVSPAAPPRPIRHCSTCDASRPFQSSGRIRLNANGQRLDAWLIYRCTTCDRTWTLPILDRVPVGSIADSDLAAMHQSDAAWVGRYEQDLVLLARHCRRIDRPGRPSVTRRSPGPCPVDWAMIDLVIEAPLATGQRLDRLLAQELGLSRSALQELMRSGGIACHAGGPSPFKRPVQGRLTLQLRADRLPLALRDVLPRRLWGP
jgi:hypothetical protein